MSINPLPKTPVYLGALGPKMLQLAGELADGAALNWCAPEQVAWSRDRIAEGAEKVGRDPSEIKVSEYIRICVDEDEDRARIALAKATMQYALGATVPTEKERSLVTGLISKGWGSPQSLQNSTKCGRRVPPEMKWLMHSL